MFTIPDPDEVTLTIGRTRFDGWSRIGLDFAIDNHPRAAFVAPFEPTVEAFRRLFEPLSYQEVRVDIGRERAFTGLFLVPDLSEDAESAEVSVPCYSRAGVLSDCHAPYSSFPLEFNGVKLKAIASRICEPYGISVEWEGDEGNPFDRLELEPETNPQQFLADRAKERNRVISSTAEGALLFVERSAKKGRPIARFEEGLPPLVGIVSKWNPQKWFSEITAISPTRHGTSGSFVTVKNPHYKSATPRPHNFSVDDATPSDLKLAAEAKLARMFGEVAAWQIGPLPTIRNKSGQLFLPGVTVSAFARGAMINRDTDLLVRRVQMNLEADSKTCQLGVVLPGSFTGQVPEAVPWAA